MYGKLNKAVYGTLLAGILFYTELSEFLKDEGFRIYPYDPCCFTKMINGSSCTLLSYVDDIYATYKDQNVLDDVLKVINNKFKTDTQNLSITKGVNHAYIGMNIDFSGKGHVRITQYDFLQDILEETSRNYESMNVNNITPAMSDVFTVDESSPLLPTDQAEYFHCITAQLLFASMKARPNLQVATAYLCTQVKSPTVSDYSKLARVIKYICAIIHLPLLLGWDETGTLTWAVDAFFAVHGDFRSQTGALLNLVRSADMAFLMKQKINFKSSTKAELIGVDDALNFLVWRFGKRSGTILRRHLSICNFYCKSLMDDNVINTVTYCPTKGIG